MRPTGVTIIAILWGIGAILSILSGIVLLIASPMMSTGFSDMGMGTWMAMSGSAMGIVLLIFGMAGLMIAYGLWTLKNWARVVTIILSAISIVLTALSLIATIAMPPTLGVPGMGYMGMESILMATVVQGVVTIVINGIILWYLMKVKHVFSQ